MAQRKSLAGAARRAVTGAKKAVQAVNPSTPRKAAAKKSTPAKAGTKAPAKAAGKAPAKAAGKAPAKAAGKAPAKAAGKAPAKAAGKAPAKAAGKAPAKAGTKAPAKAGTKAPAKAATKAPAKTSKAVAPKTTKPAAATATAPVAKAAAPAKQAPARKVPAAKVALATTPAARIDEDPWTDAEVREISAQLSAERDRLAAEVAGLQAAITDVMRDTSDGGGEDQADTGGKALEREQELTLLRNAQETLDQTEHALTRLAEGTYGNCESCGAPIGKLRLQAFPRATLCVACKQRQERR